MVQPIRAANRMNTNCGTPIVGSMRVRILEAFRREPLRIVSHLSVELADEIGEEC